MLWIVFIIVTLSCADAITKEDCPETIPKDKYTQVHGHVCYRFELDIKKEYDDAREYCLRRGGNLAIVKSKLINDFIIDALKNRLGYHEAAWIGLNDKADEEHFVWEDGTPMRYNNFVSTSGITHFFRHGLEDCVAIDVETGLWHDYKCSDYFLHIVNEHKRFICEFHVEVPDTTPAPTTTTTTPTTTTTTPTTTTTTTTPTTTTTTSTTTSKPTTVTARTTTCPELVCDLDCGMDGFKTDVSGCTICQCDSDDDSQPGVISTLPTTPEPTTTATPKPTTTATPEPTTTATPKPTMKASTTKTPKTSTTKTPKTSTTTTPKALTTATPKASTPKAPCTELLCNLDCSRLGFQRDADGCVMCSCKGST